MFAAYLQPASQASRETPEIRIVVSVKTHPERGLSLFKRNTEHALSWWSIKGLGGNKKAETMRWIGVPIFIPGGNSPQENRRIAAGECLRKSSAESAPCDGSPV